MKAQLFLFDAAPLLPDGFTYQPDLITPAEETELVTALEDLPFRAFEFHGYVGKRRVVSFGMEYDFAHEQVRPAEPLPHFLLGLREKASAVAGLTPSDLPHALVTEYGPGAAIGWHRDKGVFEDVIGVSLLAPCVFRLRRRRGRGFERASLTLKPRSVYLLRGAARTEWEHSIPAVETLRYSVTFRSLRSERPTAFEASLGAIHASSLRRV
jgi:alkylated DNA repair dioxygenase AlkB